MLDQDNLYLINLSILINWLLDNVWGLMGFAPEKAYGEN